MVASPRRRTQRLTKMRLLHLLAIPLMLAFLSSKGSCGDIQDGQAREKAKAAVRSAMQFPSTHFLRAVRDENMEEDLFSFQAKIKGRIAKFAYFYEVIENGFEIVSPEEVISHGSVDGTRKWLIAVSRQTGTVYGLLGFE